MFLFFACSIWKSSAHPSRIFDRLLGAQTTIGSPSSSFAVGARGARITRIPSTVWRAGKVCSTCLDKYSQELGSTMSRILLDPTLGWFTSPWGKNNFSWFIDIVDNFVPLVFLNNSAKFYCNLLMFTGRSMPWHRRGVYLKKQRNCHWRDTGMQQS